MRIKAIDVVTVELEMNATPTQGGGVSATTRTTQAISFRFEITADEIDLLRLSHDEVVKQGEAIATALLAFVQAEDTKWVAGEEETRKLDS